ncbi:MAG: type II secretion system minor pseudopilin GspK [Deltaproteobacteria bacterium]|nr:type II secretion system minor pseudopilin GspK [Deltaproteobacteria bacterium]
MALVITLLIITTLTGLTVAFSEKSSIELSLAGYARDQYRASQIARSGVNIALALLGQDEDKNMDSLREEWSQFGAESYPEELPESVFISGGIVDENSKININYLINKDGEIDEQRVDQLIRLFNVLGLKADLVNPILDWLDGDDDERLDGAEKFFYQSLKKPYECANMPLLTIRQIFMIKGIRDIQDFGKKGEKTLLDFLTIHSDGKININTAPGEVLQTLHEDIDGALAQSIIDYRSEEDFLTINDLRNVPGIDELLFDSIKEWLTVKSSAFSIEVEVKNVEAAAGVKAVTLREANKSILVYWQVV